jgi:hypothetical protein
MSRIGVFFWIKLKDESISTTASLRFPQDWFRPTIFVYPCNEYQLDALFIISLFRQSTSTCFGHICSPSSGDILYTEVGKSRFTVVRMEKDMQVIIITIAKIDKS